MAKLQPAFAEASTMASGEFHEAALIRARLRPHEVAQRLASALLRNVCKLLTALLLGEVFL
uniref:Uncharacterized protein n=1 Tax=Aegilops tauschii TaxID=37682 RepID=M8BAK2_AEGTA